VYRYESGRRAKAWGRENKVGFRGCVKVRRIGIFVVRIFTIRGGGGMPGLEKRETWAPGPDKLQIPHFVRDDKGYMFGMKKTAICKRQNCCVVRRNPKIEAVVES
jgi:hypothetical protein